jgi:hypothetical protein
VCEQHRLQVAAMRCEQRGWCVERWKVGLRVWACSDATCSRVLLAASHGPFIAIVQRRQRYQKHMLNTENTKALQ